jgi:glycerol-3-phosphate dehydrogenase
MEAPDGGAAAAPSVARLIAGVLGWDDATCDAQVADYRRRLTRDRAALVG